MDIIEYNFLADWLVKFLRNKDVISKSIESIEENINKHYLYVKYKDRVHIFLLFPFVEDEDILSKINEIKIEYEGSNVSIVMYNERKNLDFMLKNWTQLSKEEKLSVYFVNPFSLLDKRWIIFPKTHNSITEKTSLKKGLNALFSSVEEISKQELRRKLKN